MVDDPRKQLPTDAERYRLPDSSRDSISRNFKLRTDPEGGSSCFANLHTFDEPCSVTLEIEGPLI